MNPLISFLLPFAFFPPFATHVPRENTPTVHATSTRGSPENVKRDTIDICAISTSITCTSNFNVFKGNWISHRISVCLCFAVWPNTHLLCPSPDYFFMWGHAECKIRIWTLNNTGCSYSCIFLSLSNPHKVRIHWSHCLFSNPYTYGAGQ